MKKIITLFILAGAVLPTYAQQALTLDSCRAMALRNNKQLNAARLKQDVAMNARKAVRTKYLPKVDAVGGYELFSKEVSLLNSQQKSTFANLGTTAMANAGTGLTSVITGLAQQGILSPQVAQQLGGVLANMSEPLAQLGNQLGQDINKAFRTDTRNIWAGSIMLRQPIFMGGAITSINKMADIAENMANDDLDLRTQNTLYTIDQTYWTIVSLREKQNLAESYRNLVKKLSDDVHKMIKEGVATKADGLKVDVKVNEADMAVTQVDDGLSLAKMLLCQLCGMPIDKSITLADENSSNLELARQESTTEQADNADKSNRPELRLLVNTVDMSLQATKLIRAEYMPHVALTGGYIISNPNVFNGFQRKFSGVWNVGVLVQVPVWNWFEGAYKVRAAKATTSIARMELADAQEKIDLQIEQCRFKVKEANKKLYMTQQNIKSAEENLRCANLGFKEGVMQTTDVMAAQTAWNKAQSQKIDAEVEARLAEINLKKALGILH